MSRELSRRRFVQGVAATGAASVLAGCGDGGAGGDDGGSGGGDGGGGDDGTTAAGGDVVSATFDYTFAEGDDVVGSSLTGIRLDYPEGSGAVSNASLGNVTLGGGDVSRDIDDTTTSNDGSTYAIDFGGANGIAAGEALVLELSNVSAPFGSYDVTVMVNPQSGGTEFTESF